MFFSLQVFFRRIFRFLYRLGRRWRTPVRAAAFVALTLYSEHKSASAADWIWLGGSNTPTTTRQEIFSTNAVEGVFVEDIFDFSVPVNVISQGVHDAEMPLYWAIPDEVDKDGFYDDLEFMATNSLPDYMASNSFSQGVYFHNTNHENMILGSSDASFGFSVYGSPYSQGVFDGLSSASNLDLIGLGAPSSSFLNVVDPDIAVSIFQTVEGDTPPLTPVEGLVPVSGYNAPDDEFWVKELSTEMITELDDGALLEFCNDPPEIFGFLVFLPDSLDYVVELLNAHVVMRKIVAVGATLLWFLMFFRWWLRRIFFVVEVFSGAGAKDTDEPFGLGDSDK